MLTEQMMKKNYEKWVIKNMKKIILMVTKSAIASHGLELYVMLKQKYFVELLIEKNAVDIIPQEAHYQLFDFAKYNKDHLSKHIDISEDANLLIIYGANQNFVAKIANGFSDDLLSVTYSATNSHKIIIPEQSELQWNVILRRNYKILQDDDVEIINHNSENNNYQSYHKALLTKIDNHFSIEDKFRQKLVNKNVLINLGRTRTYIDDVRYITNNSSGKMGKALIDVFKKTKANLQIISGDVDIDLNVKTTKVLTNQVMLTEMQRHFASQDIVICVGALNDFKIAKQYQGKINKKSIDKLTIELVDDIDVLHELGKMKTKQMLIGFSAQDNFDEKTAQQKLRSKNLDLIVLNRASAFESDNNEVKLIDGKQIIALQESSKFNIAMQIVDYIVANQ